MESAVKMTPIEAFAMTFAVRRPSLNRMHAVHRPDHDNPLWWTRSGKSSEKCQCGVKVAFGESIEDDVH